MLENVSFQYNPTWILAGIAAGLLIAAILYIKNNTSKINPKSLRSALFALRTLAVILLTFLLLGPLLKQFLTEEKKPILILAQDASQSIDKALSATDKKILNDGFRSMEASLAEKYDLRTFHFGGGVAEGITDSFDQQVTDLSGLLDHVHNQYGDQNIRGFVLATDGLYNQGNNPVYHADQLQVPIFSIPLGDTKPKKDIFIKHVFHNKIAYFEDQFTVQVDVAAQNLQGKQTTISISERVDGENKLIKKVPLTINKNDFFKTEEILLTADKAGVRQYIFSVNQLEGEQSKENNRKQIFIDVLDAKQQVLIVAASPHPDLTAFKQSLSTNRNYKIEIAYPDKLPTQVETFDLLILHQLPTAKNGFNSFIDRWKSRQKPILYVVGSQTDLQNVNNLQNILDIKSNTKSTNLVQATVSSNFNYFTLDEAQKQELELFPPLIAPFAEVKERAGSQTLMYQKIGKVDTEYPLFALSQTTPKTGVLMAEGIWKWRVLDFVKNENFNAFDTFLSKVVQFLTVKDDKRRFRVTLAKNLFKENEDVTFQAEVYNDSYELINTPDVSIVIKNEKGEEFNFTFNKNSNSYQLNIGSLPSGDYSFEGSVNLNGELLKARGKFSVSPIQLELFNLVADHGTLTNISSRTKGTVYPLQEISKLENTLLDSDASKPILYQSIKTNDLLNNKIWFFIIFLMLAVEWFFRRYSGSY